MRAVLEPKIRQSRSKGKKETLQELRTVPPKPIRFGAELKVLCCSLLHGLQRCARTEWYILPRHSGRRLWLPTDEFLHCGG
jgi:hypothetical protein